MPYPRLRFTDEQVYDRPLPAICVLADALGVPHTDAAAALRALVKAGYVVAPRLPTNAMLDAYLRAYGDWPKKTSSCIIGIGKARKRWAAMAEKGTQMALSWRRVTQHEIPVTSYPSHDQNDGTAIAAGSRRAKTPQAVECEASQSGGEAASPKIDSPTASQPVSSPTPGDSEG